MIFVQVADSIRKERDGDMGLGREAGIDMAFADISDLETTVAARPEEVKLIVGRVAAEVEVRTKRRRQVAQCGVWRFPNESELKVPLGGGDGVRRLPGTGPNGGSESSRRPGR